MLNQSSLEKIKKEAEEFFRKMTFEVEVDFKPSREETVFISVKTEKPQILIGENGQTLFEIQHLLKAMLRRQVDEPFFVDLDINDYKKKKIEYLKEIAKSVADEVALTKKEVVLHPMAAYERRVVHMELAGRGDISTESIGEDPDRRIAIKPA